MATTKLQWALSLEDHLSAPASKMGRALGQLHRQLDRVAAADRRAQAATQRTAQRMAARHAAAEGRALRAAGVAQRRQQAASQRAAARAAQDRAAQSVEHQEALLGVLGAVAGAALGAAAAVGRIAVAFGESAIEAASFRQSSMTTLRTLLRSDGAARRVFSDTQRVAQLTPYDEGDLLSQRVQLTTAGFGERQSAVLQAALADTRGLFGEDRADMLATTFQRLNTSGLSGEVFESLGRIGINMRGVLDALGQATGIRRGTNDQRFKEQLLQAGRTGRLGSNQVISAILDQLRNLTGGELGQFSRDQGQGSIAGAINNAQGAFRSLLMSGDIDQTDGMRAFVAGLTSITELMSAATPRGERLRAILYSLIDDAGALFTRFANPGRLGAAADYALDLFTRIRAGVAYIAPLVQAWLQGWVQPLGAFVGMLGRFFSVLSGGRAPTEAIVAGFRMWGRFVGILQTVGLVVLAVLGAIIGAFVLVGGAVATAVSRVRAWLGVAVDAARGLGERARPYVEAFADGVRTLLAEVRPPLALVVQWVERLATRTGTALTTAGGHASRFRSGARAAFEGLATFVQPLVDKLAELRDWFVKNQVALRVVTTVLRAAGYILAGLTVGFLAAVGGVALFVGSMLALALLAPLAIVAVAAGIGYGVMRVVQWFYALGQSAGTLATTMWQRGADVVQGFVNGIVQKWQELRATVGGIFTDAGAVAASALDSHSPSRVFMSLGGFAAEGFALGLEGGTGGVTSALNAMVAPPDLSGLSGAVAGASAGAAPVGNVYITIPDAGSPEATARAVGVAVADLLGLSAPEAP